MNANAIVKWRARFLLTVQFILIITGCAKLFSSSGSSQILSAFDPVFGIQFSALMVAVGSIEIGASLSLFFIKPMWLRYLIPLWFALGFLAYRVLVWSGGHDQTCPCLGSLSEKIGLAPDVATVLLTGSIFYILVGSIFCLSGFGRANDRSLEILEVEKQTHRNK